jgi:serine/threonine-protein kinase
MVQNARGAVLLIASGCMVAVTACGSSSSTPGEGGGVGASSGQSAAAGASMGHAGTANGGVSGHGSGGISGAAAAGGGIAGASGAGAAGAGTAGAGTGQTGMVPFPSDSPFYQDISKASVDGQSTLILSALNKIGWGDAPNRTDLGIDFSFNINLADATVARRAFIQTPSFYSPDCDTAPVPLPAGGRGEGVNNYTCIGGDCHLFVYQGTRLYELYQSNITGGLAAGGVFNATCLVVWDLTRNYWLPASPPNFSRGEGCTGADAADLPMAPLVLTKQDLVSGNVKHALRFTIDNNRIAAMVYVHPATHLGGPTGGPDTLPYGARLRLRADYPLASLPNDNARIVAKGLQTYGMYLADGGNIYISATTDASDLINNAILSKLTPSDFEMIDGGTRIDATTQDCKHVPITQ